MAIQKSLWTDPYWLNLLHYERKSSRRYRSKATAQFFLRADGARNPKGELLENVRRLLDTSTWYPDPNEHPACRFPLRYEWLRRTLNTGNPSYLELNCPVFRSWYERIGPAGATLTFASSFANNPASMFGHTFLRIHREKAGQIQPDLLHYVVNFAAETGTEGGFLYSIKGLFGLYPGYFSTLPYYQKVLEYSQIDSRDIWEYPLSLSQTQLQSIVFHLWEHANVAYPYYFADENCSYYLLSLLELAQENLEFAKHLPFFTIPIDTLKIVANKTDWTQKPVYRPSRKKIFLARVSRMSDVERHTLKKTLREQEVLLPRHLREENKVAILDAAIDHTQRYNADPKSEKDQKRTVFIDQLLSARSQLEAGSEMPKMDTPVDPLQSHPTIRTGIGASYLGEEIWSHIDLRGAYHDLLDNPSGLDSSAQIQSLEGRIRFSTERFKVRLDHLKLIEILSLNPWHPNFKSPSWNVGFGVRNIYSDSCFDCTSFYIEGGPGIAVGSSTNRRFYLSGFANVFADLAPWNLTGYRLGPSANALILWDLSNRLRIQGRAMANYSPLGAPDYNYLFEGSSAIDLTHNISLRFWYTKFQVSYEAGGSVFYYF